ncbi:hypothetical protein ACVWZ8_001323 [Arthrobacter sp. UYCu723]
MKRIAVQSERGVNDAGTLAYICRVAIALPAPQPYWQSYSQPAARAAAASK